MDALSNKVDELMDRIHFFLAEDLGPVKVSQGGCFCYVTQANLFGYILKVEQNLERKEYIRKMETRHLLFLLIPSKDTCKLDIPLYC